MSDIPQSRASLSLGHLSALGFHTDYNPQSPAPLSLRQSLSQKSRNPSVSGIAQSWLCLSLGYHSFSDIQMDCIPQSRTSLSLRHLLASDISQPWGLPYGLYPQSPASPIAQPRPSPSLGHSSASGIAQPRALLSLGHCSASGIAQPRVSLSLTAFQCGPGTTRVGSKLLPIFHLR